MKYNDVTARASPGSPATGVFSLEDRKEAQARLERIQAFQLQLGELLQAGVISSPAISASALMPTSRICGVSWPGAFDLDISENQKRFSWGMRIASTLGGLAFCLAIILFFYRYWGQLHSGMQVLFLAAAPLLGLVLLGFLEKRRASRYTISLTAIVVLGAFVLNLTVIGIIFNVTPTPNAMLAWGLFALVIAYGCRLRLPLAAGLAVLIAFSAAVFYPGPAATANLPGASGGSSAGRTPDGGSPVVRRSRHYLDFDRSIAWSVCRLPCFACSF